MSDECYIGDDLVIHFEAKDVFGKVINLTGASVHCRARPVNGTTTIAAAGTVDEPPSAGRCRATFDASITSLFGPNTGYLYDGVVRLADGEIHTIGRGSFKAVPRITPQP